MCNIIRNEPLFVNDPKKGKVFAGWVYKNTFIKKAEFCHYVRIFKGYGIQEELFPIFEELGIDTIAIQRIDQNRRYISSIEMWNKKGITRDLGHGMQRFLSAKYMESKYQR